ncbi:hypothetical protein BH20ACT5_BH20ACT5_18460 [soil metagenome]
MSFILGGGQGHRDPDLLAGNRRQREHFARDINDQRTLAGGGQAPIRRRSPWLLLAAVAAFFLFAALARGGGSVVPIVRDCTQPGLALESSSVPAGSNFQLRGTGPDGVQYILALDGEPVQGQPDEPVSYRQTPAGPAFEMRDCVSPTFLVQAPVEAGRHELTLIRYAAGQASTVADLTFTVTG